MGRTPLHTATEHGHEAVVKYLLAQGADKDKADLVGYTPLQSASQYNQNALKGTSSVPCLSFSFFFDRSLLIIPFLVVSPQSALPLAARAAAFPRAAGRGWQL